jgi:N-dimethylarginine dimethylaminohydrolase
MKDSGMDDKTLMAQLEELAENLAIEIRYEVIKKEGLFFTGGLCRLKGKDILIVNSEASMGDKIQALAKALRHFDLSRVYMRPALREFLTKLPQNPSSNEG